MFIPHRRLLDQITLLHGPHDLLGRYFLIADTAARDKGIRLRLRADFDALMQLNEKYKESWPPLSPTFDPRHSNLRIDSAFWIEGVDEAGETVLTHAVRMFDWQSTTLADELRSLRVFYDDPAERAATGETAETDAPCATHIRGRNLYGGAMWVRPDRRGDGLTRIIPKISRAYAYTRWDTDFYWCFVEPHMHKGGLTRAYGAYRAEESVTLFLPFRGKLPLLLAWMNTPMMLADVAEVVDQTTGEYSRRSEMLSTSESEPRRRQGMSRRS